MTDNFISRTKELYLRYYDLPKSDLDEEVKKIYEFFIHNFINNNKFNMLDNELLKRVFIINYIIFLKLVSTSKSLDSIRNIV